MLPSTLSVQKELNSPSPASAGSERSTPISGLTLTLLTTLAAGLRFFALARKPFWLDECFSVEVARLSWHDFAFLLWRREANMALYYLLLRGWLSFGSTPYFIRSLSVIFSLAAVPAIFWLGSELFDRRVGLIAAALLSVNAYHIRYAQEARSYSLFCLLAILSSGFLVATLRRDSRRSWIGYVVSSVLAVYAHLYALLLIGAQWLAVRRQGAAHILRRSWIWIAAVTLPLVIFAAKTGAGPLRWIPRPGFREVLAFARHLCGNGGMVFLLLYAAACAAAMVPGKFWRSEGGGTSASGSDANGSDWNAWRLRFLLIWLLVPIALMLTLSLARPLFLGRYFIFCLPPLILLAAAGLARLRPAWLLAAGLAVMLLLSVRGTADYYREDFDLEREDSQGAVNYILDHSQPGDAILFHIAEGRVPYEFFKTLRENSSLRTGDHPPEIVYPNHGERLDYRDFTGKPTPEFVKSLSGRYSRLWVVLVDNGGPAHPDASTLMLNQLLGESFPRVERKDFAQVEVRLYSRP
jgi:mannosyltransferase